MRYTKKIFVCPYYRWDDRLCVKCEAGKAEFGDRREAQEYIDQYCASVTGWGRCSLARSKTKYHERKTEHEKH